MQYDPYKYIHTNKFINHAVLNLIGDSIKDLPTGDKGILPFEITMHINGKEVDIISFFDLLERGYLEDVSHIAREQVTEKVDDTFFELTELFEKIKEDVKEKARLAFPKETGCYN